MAKNYFGISDKGKMRDNNEDTFIAEKIGNDKYILVSVIDGVGGYSGGEIAAAIARKAILDKLENFAGNEVQNMREALVSVNEKIHEEKKQSNANERMACVLTMAIVNPANNVFYYAHVGDTRLYLLRDSSLVKISKDHSFVGFLEDSGRLNEAQAMSHPKRNEINKALGFDVHIDIHADYIETGESPFLPGDIIMLCSDGLSDLVTNSAMTDILVSNKTLEQKGKDLIDAANAKGGKDNITVALVHHDGERTMITATKPQLKKNEVENTDGLKQNTPVANPSQQVIVKKGGSKTLSIILSIICLVLLAALIIMIMQKPTTTLLSAATVDTSAAQVPTEQNENEKRLADSINNAVGKMLVLQSTTYGDKIMLTDTLYIARDTLHIKGTGNTTILSDSAYRGVGVLLSPSCKYILLDSLTLENFDIGVIVQSTALHLKNVRFKNCRVAVQNQFSFTDNQYVTGSVKDTMIFRAESTPQ